MDADGDHANSDFQLYTYQPDIEIDSADLFAQMQKDTVSTLSLMKITEEHKSNTRNVLTALNLVCMLYAAFQQIAPGEDVGFDLSKEFQMARHLYYEN